MKRPKPRRLARQAPSIPIRMVDGSRVMERRFRYVARWLVGVARRAACGRSGVRRAGEWLRGSIGSGRLFGGELQAGGDDDGDAAAEEVEVVEGEGADRRRGGLCGLARKR